MVEENIIEFKGSKKGILIYVKPQYDFEFVKQQLDDKIEKTQSFYKGAKIFDIHCDTLSIEQKEELGVLLKTKYKMYVLTSEEREALEKEELTESIFSGIDEGQTKFIQGTLRSGQNINFDGNVVVLGDVNPGAQVTAYGNIVVMGSLRGVAHAGANGNIKSCVAAFYLDPTQLRIADFITRAPDGDYEKPKVPELARVKDHMIYIEPYLNKK
ncbi:septum site-determining protein MinC [Alkaliphilus oremlandii]|uniref:Probable septum site-determining protein MinC n=1 Tax=Alkaliphilus oremlandii (strain OhILAs) TaxID=350688 RepID=A8MHL9_ALKOO|nr:septum site-determining protein MinC [Alkaliphilus oremlandii]ABW19301.1 septum site-determining protein MinC [Alkaliphilus oremlandii OhILAs]